MNEIITYILSVLATTISGAIIYFLQRHFKRLEKRSCDAEERNTQKDILVLKSLKSIGELTVANAIAIKEGKQNGELDKAQQEFESVDKELHAFLMESAVNKINKEKQHR